MSKITIKQIKEAVGYSADMVSKNQNDEFVLRKGFFCDVDAEVFAEKIRQDLLDEGIVLSLVEFGDTWKTSSGEVSKRKSHLFAKFKE